MKSNIVLNTFLGVVAYTILGSSPLQRTAAAPLTAPEQHSSTNHAVIIGLDGVGLDQMLLHLDKGLLPNLARLKREGAFKEGVRSVSPTDSLPNWMAALSSGLVEFTGISSNDWGREVDNSLISVGGKCDYFPTIFQVVAALETKKQQQQQKQQQQGQPTSVPAIPDMAAFFDWEKFQDILRPKVYFQELFEVDRDNDQKLVDRATTYWRLHKPRLSFVYLGQVDNAGHGYGYGDAYTRELIEADRHIGQLLQALDEAGMLPRTTVAVVSDHGRMATGYGHGRTADLESNTHMFLWGPATIRRGYNISRAVSILDTSPTILAALGLGPGPSQWRGVPLHEALLPDSEAWHAASAAWRETEMGVSASWAYIEDQPDAEDPCRIRMEQGTLLPEKQMMERVLLYLVSHFDTNYVRGFLTGILLTLILGMCWGTLLCGRACVLKFMRGQDGWKPLPVIPNTNAVQTPDP